MQNDYSRLELELELQVELSYHLQLVGELSIALPEGSGDMSRCEVSLFLDDDMFIPKSSRSTSARQRG